MEEVDDVVVVEKMKKQEVPEDVKKWLEESRRRRERLKLEILASLSKVKKADEAHGMAKARRNTLDVTMLAVMDVGREMEVDVRGMSAVDGLKLRFAHCLANKREEDEMKAMQKEEIEKMREVQEKARKEKVKLEESLRLVKLKNRRLSRYLQQLQTRLVSSVIALNYQMSRKVELSRQLSLLNYYRDISLENSFAFLYGQLPNEPSSIPLGGVFSPYAYVDYNEEEERLEKEYTWFTTLCPPSFRASAQQRRVSFRMALIQSFQLISPFVQTNKPASIEYASLDQFAYFSADPATNSGSSVQGGSPAVPHLIPLRSSSSNLATSSQHSGDRHKDKDGHKDKDKDGHKDHKDHGDGIDSPSSSWSVANGVQSSLSPTSAGDGSSKRANKALKPSLSDRPTKHEGETSPRKPPSSSGSGIFSLFKGSK